MSDLEILKQKAIDFVSKCLGDLSQLWDELGYSEAYIAQRASKAISCIDDACKKLVNDETDHKSDLENEVTDGIQKIHFLETALELKENLFSYDNDQAVLRILEVVNVRLRDLEDIRNDRMKMLTKVAEEERRLCAELDVKSLCPQTDCPRHDQIQAVQEHVSHLFQLKREREQTLSQYTDEIFRLRMELEDPSIGMQFITRTNSLSLRSLDEMRLLIGEKIHVIEENELKAKSLIERISHLNALMERKYERPAGPLGRPSIIRKLENELMECEEKKKARLPGVIENLRQKVSAFWDSCFCSQDERRSNLPSFFEGIYTEDVLEQHERELNAMKLRYDRYREMYETISQWVEMMNDFAKFKLKSADPSRFHLRGYSMAQEAKERKRFQLQLPKLECSAKELIKIYEIDEDCPFQYFGMGFADLYDQLNQKVETEPKAVIDQKNVSKRVTASRTGRSTSKTPAAPLRVPLSSTPFRRPILERKPCIVLETSIETSRSRQRFKPMKAPSRLLAAIRDSGAFRSPVPSPRTKCAIAARKILRRSIHRNVTVKKLKLCTTRGALKDEK